MSEGSKDFRDKISTVDEEGKRVWVYPKKPKGSWFNKRKLLSYVLLIILFGAPYIKIGGEALIMINIIERKFVLFGQVFWPQDFYIFAFGAITFVVFIILFTVIFGRLFCGWVCPQTIFMEMVFRRIEYWIEGDYKHQKRLNAAPWNADKIKKKTLKHSIFWIISFLIANTFLSYIIGYEALWEIILDTPANHIVGLLSIVIFTTVFYLVFAQMREQVCVSICPYGRLQSVLLDRKSLVVAYDHVRGEGRAKFKKNEDRNAASKGDCVDCNQCVDVCPTGIDIRNGTQLECVNCTACIDACNTIMKGVNLEPNLIRYDSEEGIVNKSPFQITARVKAYSILLIALLGVLATLLITRNDFEVKVLRTRGTLVQKMADGQFGNFYDLYLQNKTSESVELDVRLIDSPGTLQLVAKQDSVPAFGETTQRLIVLVNRAEIDGRSMPMTIGIYSDGELTKKVKTSFLGPSF